MYMYDNALPYFGHTGSMFHYRDIYKIILACRNIDQRFNTHHAYIQLCTHIYITQISDITNCTFCMLVLGFQTMKFVISANTITLAC